ncbi:uncharacterized protein LOC105841429 [Bombyx mori]|uniref:Uncharacterized protein n=1 Tax=Bombyx mori TaxID=7091 RepID=A0A8R2DJR0_BOMMO|nr:uncharacterized protein LOC105841429 [Bombyx mori]
MALVYSCCFWFSLRLGGILIGLFCLFQAIFILILCCLGYTYANTLEDEITEWINNYNLIYAEDYLINVSEDPVKYISFTVTLSCFYIFICIMFIYGAFVRNNILMVSFILLELLRLVMLSTLVATGLLILKQNTMDIGVLIGASVFGGFLLLGMFYLWICCANLPILINEMERDEQSKTIEKLQKIIKMNSFRTQAFGDHSAIFQPSEQSQKIFVTPKRKIKNNNVNTIRHPIRNTKY